MIAKLIVWDRDRRRAAERLHAALLDYEVAGVQTNLDLLRGVVSNPDFLAADFDTGFLERHPELLVRRETEPPLLALAAAAAAVMSGRAAAARAAAAASGDMHSPWAAGTAWRLNGDGYQDLLLRTEETEYALRAHPHPGGSFRLEVSGAALEVARQGEAMLSVDDVLHRAPVAERGGVLMVLVDGSTWRFSLVDPLAPPQSEGVGEDRLIAPMPGRIVSLHTEPGARVGKGDVLLVLEAMKVQMRLTAPRDGIVAAIRAKPGDLVEEGVELVVFATRP